MNRPDNSKHEEIFENRRFETRKIGIIALSVLGFGLAGWLTYLHVRLHLDPGYSAICAVGEHLNCESVAASEYSVLLGIPVSVFGLAAYLAVAAFTVAGAYGATRRGMSGVLVLLSGAMSLVGVLLGVISAVLIGALCLFCSATYLVNFGLLGLSIAEARGRGGIGPAIAGDVGELARDRWFWINLVLALALLVAAGPGRGYPRYWELASWRSGYHLPRGTTEEGHPWLGAPEPTTIVHEYFDFNCPGCRASHLKLRRALSRSGGKRLRVIRHDFNRVTCEDEPGTPVRGRCAVMKAARCAGREGRYWDWNDAVLAHPPNRTDMAPAALSRYVRNLAEGLGFAADAFERCVDSPEISAEVERLRKQALRNRVRFTPSYRIYGKPVKLIDVIDRM